MNKLNRLEHICPCKTISCFAISLQNWVESFFSTWDETNVYHSLLSSNWYNKRKLFRYFTLVVSIPYSIEPQTIFKSNWIYRFLLIKFEWQKWNPGYYDNRFTQSPNRNLQKQSNTFRKCERYVSKIQKTKRATKYILCKLDKYILCNKKFIKCFCIWVDETLSIRFNLMTLPLALPC